MPRYSVVVTVYNKQDFIQSTLESVLRQSQDDFEILVIDDGSTDNSAEVIQGIDDDRITYFYQANRGAAAARNLGIAEARSSFIALMDGDDLWHPDYLATIDRLHERHPLARVLATGYEINGLHHTYPAEYSISKPKNAQPAMVSFFGSSEIHSLLTSSSAVIHRSVFDQVGFYDETITSGQDTDLWIRIGLHYQVAFDPEIRVTLRYDKQSLSKQNTSFDTLLDLDRYAAEEAQHPELKKFLDLNRFSFALKARLWNEAAQYKRFRESIDLTHLNWKQRFLLRQPAAVLRILLQVKRWAERRQLYWSAFR
ncbi:glycosyltransferase family 2 protein [Croceiramulus getboli]|nr:glycosyltransferase [Flavobacteriaceae bacterium YJPT1-3]